MGTREGWESDNIDSKCKLDAAGRSSFWETGGWQLGVALYEWIILRKNMNADKLCAGAAMVSLSMITPDQKRWESSFACDMKPPVTWNYHSSRDAFNQLCTGLI